MRQLELAQLVWSEKRDGVFSSPCTLQYISVWFLSFFSFPVKKKEIRIPHLRHMGE